MITFLIIVFAAIAIIRWVNSDRKYKEAQTRAMTPQKKEEPEVDDTEYTVHIAKDKKLDRVQWIGDGTWKYWDVDRPSDYKAQTYEYNHKKRNGVDYLIVIEDS